MVKERAGIQSVEVGFGLLQALGEAAGPLMLRDLARAANMSAAKAHRYLVSFQRLQLVVQDAATTRYDLGPAALKLGLAALWIAVSFGACYFARQLDFTQRQARSRQVFAIGSALMGAAVVLIPNFPLINVIIGSQVLNGILLPVVLIFMLRLINKHELMGKYTNSRWFNVVAWLTTIIVICLSLVLMWNGLHGGS